MLRHLPLLLLGASLMFADWSEERQVLHTIASAEAKNWDQTLQTLHKDNICETLNVWADKILQQGDLSLIELLRRALENYNALSEEKTAPFVTHYAHYRPPQFAIPQIDLTLDVQKDKVEVMTHLQVEPVGHEAELVLHGVGHTVQAVWLNEDFLSKEQYRVTPNELIILDVPRDQPFTLTVASTIDPFHNHTLEGLYETDGGLITQCESEGARRIFFTLDRPDVLSRITTTLIADAEKYPYRLSNGNCKEETLLSCGRTRIVWEDPLPKPSYLFAVVLGDFAQVRDTYQSQSGREISLEVYVPQGAEQRALYSLYALKKAMQFDEEFFDREYDLDSLKMVAAPDFNSGAMENKGLLIFNSLALLIDAQTGTDANFRRVAGTVAHEYFHNWSGNRVTVRNWFEIALKEAFTDFRTSLFSEWLFGSALVRPDEVTELREGQFPEELSESGHPIIVESFVNPRSIYDGTTYVKGREVFRAMQTILNSQVPDGFRKAQNLYFERYDGQAVTFRELLNAANEILAQAEKQDLSQFERWFTQQGTPRIHAQMHFHPDAQMCELSLTQSCPHPRTLMEQEPLLIPFSYEMFRKDGSVAVAQEEIVLSEKEHRICIPSEEALIPLFLHNYPAPVILDASYSLEDLSCLVRFATDPFARWDAHHNYSLLALSLAHDRTQADPDADCSDLYEGVVLALQNEHLSPLEKAQMLQVPSLRALSQRTGLYDFGQLEQTRTLHRKGVALACKPLLLQWLKSSPPPDPLVATAEEMAIRRLRNVCWDLLTLIEPERLSQTLDEEMGTPNFDTTLALFRLLLDRGSPQQLERMAPFYHRCKTDKVLLTHWLRAHASSSRCTVADLRKLMQLDGFVGRNPNHIRAVSGAFAYNLARYHDEKGEGYAFLVDQILAVSAFNPHLANRLAQDAFIDFERLPEKQRALMRKEMQRLLVPAVPPEIRALVSATLDGAHAA